MSERLQKHLWAKTGESREDRHERILMALVDVITEELENTKAYRANARRDQARVDVSLKCLKTSFDTYAKSNDERWRIYEPLLIAEMDDEKMWQVWRNKIKMNIAEWFLKGCAALMVGGVFYWLGDKGIRFVKWAHSHL